MQVKQIARIVVPGQKLSAKKALRLEDLVAPLLSRAKKGRTHEWKDLVILPPERGDLKSVGSGFAANLLGFYLIISTIWFKSEPVDVVALKDALFENKHKPQVKEAAYYLTLNCLWALCEFGFLPKLESQADFRHIAKEIYDIFYEIMLEAK